jgi:hypothetical protein
MAMEEYVHEQNLAHYRRLLAGTAHESQRQQILILLSEEEAKDRRHLDGPAPPQ